MSPYGFHTHAAEVAKDFSSNIQGKTILITGVSPNSLGAHFVEVAAEHSPSLIILASRTQKAADATTAAIHNKNPNVQVRTVIVELNSLASVRKAASKVVAMQNEGIVIDVFVLNAGVMACPYDVTTDGFERQFGTNHLSHFVFGNHIIPGMLGDGRKPRVVVVSSEGHLLGPVRFADPGFEDGKNYDKWRAYGQAKSANSLYAWSLAEKLGPKGLQAFSVHPGGISTNINRHVNIEGEDMVTMMDCFRSYGFPHGFAWFWEKNPFKTIEEGTSTHMVAAFADNLEPCTGWSLKKERLELVLTERNLGVT